MTYTAFYVGPENKQQTEGRHSSLSEGGRVSTQATHIREEEPEREDIGKAKTCPLCQNDFGGLLFTNNTLCQVCGKVSTLYMYIYTAST